MPKKEKSPRVKRGREREGGRERRTKEVEERASSRRQDDSSEETLVPLTPPFPFTPSSSAVSSFSVTPCTSSRIALPPARSSSPGRSVLRERHESKSLRRRAEEKLKELEEVEEREKKGKTACTAAHRALWYRRRGLPFTLHLFYFIFRGINVFGALSVG